MLFCPLLLEFPEKSFSFFSFKKNNSYNGSEGRKKGKREGKRRRGKKKLTLSPQIVLRDHVRKVNATRLNKLHAVLSRMTRKKRVSGIQFEIAGI